MLIAAQKRQENSWKKNIEKRMLNITTHEAEKKIIRKNACWLLGYCRFHSLQTQNIHTLLSILNVTFIYDSSNEEAIDLQIQSQHPH